MSRWDKQQKKWQTFTLAPRARHVNPTALWKLCRLSPQCATQLASGLLWTKVCNQHEMHRFFDPRLAEKLQLKRTRARRNHLPALTGTNGLATSGFTHWVKSLPAA